MKTALTNFDTIKREYDPYQMKEYANESGFDPYFALETQESIYMPEDEDEDDQNDDEIKDMTNDDNKVDVYYCDVLETTDIKLPATKRLRSAASSAVDSVTNNVFWGTMTAIHYANSEKKNAQQYYKDYKKRRSSPPPSQCYTLFDDRKNDNVVAMRGYGVDFAPIFDKSPYMQSKINASEKRIHEMRCDERKLAEREAVNKRIASYGGKYTKRPIDDTWGFVEHNCTVQFKPTLLAQQIPSRKASVNHHHQQQPIMAPHRPEISLI